MYSILLLSSLLHFTTCTVYTVTPNDHYCHNTTCHHCHNLQHYLLNVTKYFTSKTQLFFLPGLHHLHTDLIIQNVHNISLIGSITHCTTQEVVIQCKDSPTYITLTNVSILTIKNLVIEMPNIDHYVLDNDFPKRPLLTIEDCFLVSVDHLQVKQSQGITYSFNYILNVINIMGNSHFNQLILPNVGLMRLLYTDHETYINRRHDLLTLNNSTVTTLDLYVNIISINTPVFFNELNHFTPTYTFISLANLDLGIQTCFYNGMDDYAKMWLQLAFPFYLIFNATLIIITSRYSTTIQRLTARRALPVLATLFLLSYTKILHILSNVLFFYSTFTHLPSKHTTLAWSVDANVPLFGVRFTILFIVCLILFLILVPFNVILLFTRPLSRFKFINKFKPLLDSYQGPYKDKFYYLTGLQLLPNKSFVLWHIITG